MSKYTGNPNMEVITSVSSELLGVENITISYTSSDENIMKFTTKDGKVYWGCGIDSDIGTSSVKALVSAVNKMLANN